MKDELGVRNEGVRILSPTEGHPDRVYEKCAQRMEPQLGRCTELTRK